MMEGLRQIDELNAIRIGSPISARVSWCRSRSGRR